MATLSDWLGTATTNHECLPNQPRTTNWTTTCTRNLAGIISVFRTSPVVPETRHLAPVVLTVLAPTAQTRPGTLLKSAQIKLNLLPLRVRIISVPETQSQNHLSAGAAP